MDEGIGLATTARPLLEEDVPAARRCAMPEQKLWSNAADDDARGPGVQLARWFLVLSTIAATAAFSVTLYAVLSVQRPTPLQIGFLVLCTVCFGWMVTGSISAMMGFVALASGRGIDTVSVSEPATTGLRSRTALLFPVYREDMSTVAANVETMCEDLEKSEGSVDADVFILSDTQNETERRAERAAYKVLRSRMGRQTHICIRWRTPNIGRKAGNIRDWIETYGAGYDYFVVLDADSIMSPAALSCLVATMDAHPQAGLMQTVPRLVGARSLFARLQQFAAGYYGPIIAAGIATWYGATGNYWGHNAIVRTKAFAAAAGLPVLAGRPPFGGHILSHDFVEAALLRRAGWQVHFVPSLGGSFEGCPPALDDLIARDRRWAQGNLQHLFVLAASRLRLVSRMHLAMGAMAYIASAVWALTLLVGVILSIQAKYARPTYFDSEETLFPQWPVFDAKKALILFFVTMAVVYLPKILGILWVMRNGVQRTCHGGAVRIVSGLVFESLCSTLIAPVLMLTQTRAIAEIILGRDSGWAAQRRNGADTSLLESCLNHRWQLLIGLGLGGGCAAISISVLAWMSPIVLGLLLAGPLAFATSRESSRSLSSLLATSEDREAPQLLVWQTQKQCEWQQLIPRE